MQILFRRRCSTRFLGAGTTALVAARLGREWIGIELSPGYADMARRRLGIGPQLQKAA